MRRALLAGSAVLVLGVVLALCTIRIAPNHVGVRTDNFSLGRVGIVPRDFGPGLHLNVPVLHRWNVLPAHVRRMEMTKDARYRSAIGGEPLLVQSSDGDRVMIDLDVFFRIQPGMAHRLLQDSGTADAHVRVLASLARDRLRSTFGTMRTEEFYAPATRLKKSQEALVELRAALEPRYILPIEILIQDVEFEPKYEQKIKDKKLTDQQVELNKAQGRAAAENAKVGVIRLDTTRQVKLIEANAEAEAGRIRAEAAKYAAEKKAEADLYRDQLRAKGSLAVARSEAKVKKAMTSALGGSGGANLAALESVKNVKIDKIAFPTAGSDWFDVRQMAARLGARP